MQQANNKFDYRNDASFAGFTAQSATSLPLVKHDIKLAKHANDKVRIAIAKRNTDTTVKMKSNSLSDLSQLLAK